MKEASFYIALSENRTKCLLCPHNCTIHDGKRGICGVRININGILYSEVYGKPVSINSDPIEKKPLYHFYPGTQILSIGTVGCNLKCKFCQNCQISQTSGEKQSYTFEKSINDILQIAQTKQKNIGLAYTYNEPIVFYEFMTDLAIEIHKRGMKNVMVSNGFINPEPLRQLLNHIDAFNIDLKSFSEEFYKDYTSSSLDPVLESIKTIHQSGKHIELTFLAIPGINDDIDLFDIMLDWIVKSTDENTVLHISRYFPNYQMQIPPTPFKTLESLYHRAKKKLRYVYLGNVPEAYLQDTICPECQSLLVKRNGYYTINEGLAKDGSCKVCNCKVIKYMAN